MKPPMSMGQRAMQAAKLLDGPIENRNGLTRDAVCKLFDVSRTVVGEARYVCAHGAPEVVRAVEAGQVAVGTALKLINNVAKTEQADALATFLSTSGNARIMKTFGQVVPPRRLRPQSDKQLVKTLESLTVCANFLPEIINRGDLAADEQCQAWIKELKVIRRNITRAAKLLEQQQQLLTKNGDLRHGQ